jgi:ferritin-like protein
MQNENKINENINVVGVKVLEQNGINVNEVIKQLVYNASVEFTAYYYFTNLRMHCTGQEGESIKGIIEDARLEDLSHFESCLSRIYELGGILPIDAQEFIRMSGCEFLQLPSPKKNRFKRNIKKVFKSRTGSYSKLE